MTHLRVDSQRARRLLAAGLALAVLAAFWTLVTATPQVRTIADTAPHARSIELPSGAQDTVQYRSGALRAGPRLTARNDLDQLASRLLAAAAAAAFVVLAGSWWTRIGRVDLVRTSVVPRVGLRLRGPPA